MFVHKISGRTSVRVDEHGMSKSVDWPILFTDQSNVECCNNHIYYGYVTSYWGHVDNMSNHIQLSQTSAIL